MGGLCFFVCLFVCFCFFVVVFFCLFSFFLFVVVVVFKSRLSYLPFLMPHLLGDGWKF